MPLLLDFIFGTRWAFVQARYSTDILITNKQEERIIRTGDPLFLFVYTYFPRGVRDNPQVFYWSTSS